MTELVLYFLFRYVSQLTFIQHVVGKRRFVARCLHSEPGNNLSSITLLLCIGIHTE
jgi:hypothetical protein